MSAGDEDCLVVDVFTPKLGYDTPLPVVVYVGGASVGHDHHRCVWGDSVGQAGVRYPPARGGVRGGRQCGA